MSNISYIKLSTCNDLIIIDKDIFELFSQYKFYKDGRGHVYRSVYIGNRKSKNVKIHREIMGVTDSKIQIDHINGNKLDNRRENLRICNNQQNNCNKTKIKGTSSKYKGVTWDKSKNRWKAGIRLNYKSIYIGIFKDENDAAIAYNNKAIELFGEFAYLNEVI